MCGIVGYLGQNQALPILLDGLRRLEYRGYDSSGIALCADSVYCAKSPGKISELEKRLPEEIFCSGLGVAHTRWATHGTPSESNAHPHSDCSGSLWLVHNGIIENYKTLKRKLKERGHKFKSETDSEVLAHLIEDYYNGNLTQAVKKALSKVSGAYGIAVFHKNEPEKIVAAKNGSPLVVGLGEAETIIASDVSAIIRRTRQVIYLDDGEIAEINGNGFKIIDLDENEISKSIEEVEWSIEEAELGGYPHFMLKEIHEQKESILNSVRGRIFLEEGKAKLGGLEQIAGKLRQIDKIIIVGCGTARFAGLVGKNMLEEYAGISTEVEYASEFRYRQPIINEKTAVLALSQSGETADTIAALREAKDKGAITLGIVNTVGSTISRETDAGIYNHIGPEIAVASTKAFTSQTVILALLAVFLGRQRKMSFVIGKRILEEILALPEKISFILDQSKKIQKIAENYSMFNHFAFLGRKYNLAIAAEAALKLKEISYIHAEGFPAGELKHGSIALVDKNFPGFFIMPQDSVYEKNLSGLEEFKSRKGRVIALTTEGNHDLEQLADDVIFIPKTLEMLTPLLAVVPTQLFAYYAALARGCDIDKPRNLAKSVTVE